LYKPFLPNISGKNLGTSMKRSKFLTWLGLGSISSWLSVAIAACTNNSSTTEATPSAPGGAKPTSAVKVGDFIKAGTVKELEKQGRLLVKEGNTSVSVDRKLFSDRLN
jgi:hypothetical protein